MSDDEYEDLSPEDRVRRAANQGAPDPSESIWDDEEALSSLTMERSVKPDETNEQMTKRLLEEAGPTAAMRIIHIALHDQNSNTALRAAQYITDKAYGDDSTKSGEALWEKLVGEVVSEAELTANRGRE